MENIFKAERQKQLKEICEMKKEEKDLLLKDICARLPYGVKLNANYIDFERIGKLFSINNNEELILSPDNGYPFDIIIEKCKPYLFPLSRLNNLTEEQRKTLKVMCDWNDEEADAQSILVLYQKHFVMKTDVIDWLNENHFDYRGLIEKGLAIDATGLKIY
jgi:hypothetical protein